MVCNDVFGLFHLPFMFALLKKIARILAVASFGNLVHCKNVYLQKVKRNLKLHGELFQDYFTYALHYEYVLLIFAMVYYDKYVMSKSHNSTVC